MARERIDLDMPDLSDFKARNSEPQAANTAEVRQVAEARGFQTRHAPAREGSPAAAQPFDARSLRRTGRSAKLNIATREETRQRFWQLAQEMNLAVGEEVLIALMNAYEQSRRR